MSELERLVIAWRDARREIFQVDWGALSGAEGYRLTLWIKLGEAEAALMKFASTLGQS